MITFEYFFMLPIAFIVSTIAMSTLVGGATFFAPIFILILKLEPSVAIAVALLTQTFGFGTGLIRYMKQKGIDYAMGFSLILITIPYSIIGSYLSTILNPFFIRILLGLILIYIGYNLLIKDTITVKRRGKIIKKFELPLISRNNNKIQLTPEQMQKSVFRTSISSLFLGMTSAGLGEVLGFDWIKKTNANLKTIVATTVFVIAITTFVTSISHFYNLFTTNREGLKQSINILIFTIPGVIAGGFFGTSIIDKINQNMLLKTISIFLMIAGAICFLPI